MLSKTIRDELDHTPIVRLLFKQKRGLLASLLIPISLKALMRTMKHGQIYPQTRSFLNLFSDYHQNFHYVRPGKADATARFVPWDLLYRRTAFFADFHLSLIPYYLPGKVGSGQLLSDLH